MNKKSGIILICVGVLLVFCAVGLYIYNQSVDESAGDASNDVLSEMKVIISSESESETAEPDGNDGETDANKAPAEEITPTVEIDGNLYIGFLSIPVLELELPVLSEWNEDYSMLDIAPCRHFGSHKSDDLVIAGHNYVSHFANLAYLQKGHRISFTSAEGEVIEYSVKDFRIVQPDDIESVRSSGYDLVLYTCNYSGNARYTVFCDRVEAE